MTDQHPITPPPELVQQWMTEARSQDYCSITEQVAFHAAQWAADMELEACCEVLARELICDGKHVATDLHMIRRPKPPSLKEQALKTLKCLESESPFEEPRFETIRRALEQLDD